jgi:hypothetical protein
MQNKRRATVPIKKYTLWFFKIAAGVFIYFEEVLMKIIKNYFKCDAVRKEKG